MIAMLTKSMMPAIAAMKLKYALFISYLGYVINQIRIGDTITLIGNNIIFNLPSYLLLSREGEKLKNRTENLKKFTI